MNYIKITILLFFMNGFIFLGCSKDKKKIEDIAPNHCVSKVVVFWSEDISITQKENIMMQAFATNRELEILRNGYENMPKSTGMDTRNHFRWLYFTFGENINKCSDKYLETEKIFRMFFSVIPNAPKYQIINGDISKEELDWLKTTRSTKNEYRSKAIDSNGKVLYFSPHIVPIDNWLMEETKKNLNL